MSLDFISVSTDFFSEPSNFFFAPSDVFSCHSIYVLQSVCFYVSSDFLVKDQVSGLGTTHSR